MSKARNEYYGAIKVLQTFPNFLITQAIEKINDYVINNLEETIKLDNQIITNLHEEKMNLKTEKAELLEFIRYMYYNVGLDENEEKKFDTILQKHTGE